MILNESYTLSNGIQIPKLGLRKNRSAYFGKYAERFAFSWYHSFGSRRPHKCTSAMTAPPPSVREMHSFLKSLWPSLTNFPSYIRLI